MVIIFDGICNNVFFSQVIEPLTKLNAEAVILVSFEIDREKAKQKLSQIKETIPANFKIKIIPRFAFLGNWTLSVTANHLVPVLQGKFFDQIICRGIFAAQILSHATEKLFEQERLNKQLRFDAQPTDPITNHATIYIAGLAREEVFLIDKHLPIWTKSLLWIKAHLFSWLAKSVEANIFTQQPFKSTIIPRTEYQFCCEELGKHLTSKFAIPPNISSTTPNPSFKLDTKEKLAARDKVREKLNIAPETEVYVYSGGMQSWQSFDLNLEKFLEIQNKNKNTHILVLTKNLPLATKIIKHSQIKKPNYTLLCLEPQNVMEYLFACDYGLLMREHNLVNWTSRPVKALEYRQAGLLTIHNNSVAWVIKN